MAVTSALVHQRLTELSHRRSFDALLELFTLLGYQYADELPVPTADWPDGVRTYLHDKAEPPMDLAQHRRFHVVCTHLSTSSLLRTLKRHIVEYRLSRLHPFSLRVLSQDTGGAEWLAHQPSGFEQGG